MYKITIIIDILNNIKCFILGHKWRQIKEFYWNKFTWYLCTKCWKSYNIK